MSAGAPGVQDHFSLLAQDWATRYRTTESFATRLQVVGAAIRDTVAEGDDVLDFGCGAGVFAAVASSRAGRVVAVDINGDMLRASTADPTLLARIVAPLGVAYRPHVVERVNAGIDALAANARFDVAIAIAVLEYVPDLPAHVRALAASLRPGGRLLVTYPDARSLVRRVEGPVDRLASRAGRALGNDRLVGREYSGLRPRPEADFGALLGRVGLVDVHPVPVPLGSSALRRRLAPNQLWAARAPESSKSSGSAAPSPRDV